MANNRHRQIEKARKAELIRARREFEAKGYDIDKVVEVVQVLADALCKIADSVMNTMQKVSERICQVVNENSVSFEEAANALNNAMVRAKEENKEMGECEYERSVRKTETED